MATMDDDPRDGRDDERVEQRAIEAPPDDGRLSGVCLNELLTLIRRRTNELVPDYTIIEFRRPLPPRTADGLFFSTSWCMGRLEMVLGDLRVAVMEGEMTAERAVERAREEVLAGVMEMRFGARLRRRFFVPAALSPSAELGRLLAIVEHLADDLEILGEQCFGVSPRSPSAAPMRFYIHPMQQ